MSHILILDTSTEVCSVAVIHEDQILSLIESEEDFSHTSVLTLQIKAAMEESGLKMSDLDAVALSSGPGSYTGLRVGSATAKGLAYGLNIPLIALDSLKGLSYGVNMDQINKDETHYIISMIDARRDEVYSNIYTPDHEPLDDIKAIILDGDSFKNLRNPGTMWHLVGNGAIKAEKLLNYPEISISDVKSSAGHFTKLAYEAYKSKNFVDIAYFTPYYHKVPNITISKKKPF